MLLASVKLSVNVSPFAESGVIADPRFQNPMTGRVLVVPAVSLYITAHWNGPNVPPLGLFAVSVPVTVATPLPASATEAIVTANPPFAYPFCAAISAALLVALTVQVPVVVSTTVSAALGAALVSSTLIVSDDRLCFFIRMSVVKQLNLVNEAIVLSSAPIQRAA